MCEYCVEDGTIIVRGGHIGLWSGVCITDDRIEISINYEDNGLEAWNIHISYCPFCGRELH